MAFSPGELAMEMGVRTFGADHAKALAPVDSRSGWYPLIREPYAGAWQQNKEISHETQLAYYVVYSCITLIANDIGKLRPRLVRQDGDGIWSETDSPAFSPVLRKPNRYQNHIQFKEWWVMSKLTRGNTYALKQRDNRGVVTALYLLDPTKVEPLVSPDGAIYYRLRSDDLNGVKGEEVIAPASEIIHDRMNCLFHPLVGVSPLYACGVAAGHGLAMQQQSSTFFGNGARPSGVLIAPGAISQEAADRVKQAWETKFTGQNAGSIAVLSDGMKYEPMVMSATDSKLVEQLKMTAEIVCSVFHVPPAKIGLAQDNNASNAEIRDRNYYSDCLQSHIEQFELCMDEGLGIGYGVKVEGRVLGVDLDVDGGLWRMDTASLISAMGNGVAQAVITTDEARSRLELPRVKGGDVIWRQQQYYSLADLADRTQEEVAAQIGATPAAPASPPSDGEADAVERGQRAMLALNTIKAIEAARTEALR